MTSSAPLCKLCGQPTEALYHDLSDRIGPAQGTWNLFQCSNPECRLILIDPMPDAAALAKAYESYYTHQPTQKISRLRLCYLRARRHFLCRRFGYPSRPEPLPIRLIGWLLGLIPHRRIALESLVIWLPAKPGGQLLEIGCGNGERLELLRDLGWQVYGIEPDAKAAQAAKARNLDIFAGELQAGHLPTGSFDAILMSHVIEHVPNPREIIAECLRLLCPGGVLIMLTPNTQSLGHRWFRQNWLPLDPPRHLHLFNRHNLSKMCQETGFSPVQCTSTPRDAQWTLGASLAFRRQKRYTVGQLPLDLRLLGLGLFYLQWFMLMFQPENGEEILVKAQRPTTDQTE